MPSSISRGKLFTAILLFVLAVWGCRQKPVTATNVENSLWPSLSEFPALQGRAATVEDVAQGRAAFVAMHGATPVGTPISMPLPQYALYRDEDSKAEKRCVLIQAEKSLGKELYGVILLPDRKMLSGYASDFRLLGQTPPRE